MRDIPNRDAVLTTDPRDGLNSVLERNIEALFARRKEAAESASREERFVAALTRFTGSMDFVYIHLIVFGLWIFCNLVPLPGIPQFDPSLVILGTLASVEAIFLSTFVLISQNRMSAAAGRRADLDVQITLLTEHELTRVLAVVTAIQKHLNIKTEVDHEVDELKKDVAPEAVLDKIEHAEGANETPT